MRTPPPKKSLGQHFLSDPAILARIVEGAGVREGEGVLEIGPGPGGLTRALLGAGARVWAVEADPRMVEHLRSAGLAGVVILAGDALETDYLALAREAGGPFRLVGNLPYGISGPLLARLLRQRKAFVSMTVMLQREVGERLLAPPGGRSRGVLGVMAQTFCRPRAVLRLGPGAFRPPPKVDSVVVRMDVRSEAAPPVEDEDTLWEAVRTAFGQRRKMLRNSLRGLCPEPEALLRNAGIEGTQRPEDLTTEAWIDLANALARVRCPREG